LYLPKSYAQNKNILFPLVMFLHGSGERGTHLRKLQKHGLPKLIAAGQDLPCIVISPQCPPNTWWGAHFSALRGILEDTIAHYRIDTSRMYLTGLSMGGYGTWEFATQNPNLFAALVPICGGGRKRYGFPNAVQALKDTPIWAFHGAKDRVVLPSESQTLVRALQACGANPRFTLYADLSHNCWDAAYTETELFDWLLSHKKPTQPVSISYNESTNRQY
jgi:predicted peptidase